MQKNRFAAPIAAALLTLAGGATLLTSTASIAQPYGQPGFRPGDARPDMRPGDMRQGGQSSNEWEIQTRIQRAQERIQRGQGDGLTKKEARRLTKELDSIRNREAQLRADGRLGRRDRDELDRRIDELNRHIRAERTDGKS